MTFINALYTIDLTSLAITLTVLALVLGLAAQPLMVLVDWALAGRTPLLEEEAEAPTLAMLLDAYEATVSWFGAEEPSYISMEEAYANFLSMDMSFPTEIAPAGATAIVPEAPDLDAEYNASPTRVMAAAVLLVAEDLYGLMPEAQVTEVAEDLEAMVVAMENQAAPGLWEKMSGKNLIRQAKLTRMRTGMDLFRSQQWLQEKTMTWSQVLNAPKPLHTLALCY